MDLQSRLRPSPGGHAESPESGSNDGRSADVFGRRESSSSGHHINVWRNTTTPASPASRHPQDTHKGASSPHQRGVSHASNSPPSTSLGRTEAGVHASSHEAKDSAAATKLRGVKSTSNDRFAATESLLLAAPDYAPRWAKRHGSVVKPGMLVPLGDEDPANRRVGLWHCTMDAGGKGDARAVAVARAMARDPDAGVRQAALDALRSTGEQGDGEVMACMAGLAKDPEVSIRRAAIENLAEMVPDPAVDTGAIFRAALPTLSLALEAAAKASKGRAGEGGALRVLHFEWEQALALAGTPDARQTAQLSFPLARADGFGRVAAEEIAAAVQAAPPPSPAAARPRTLRSGAPRPRARARCGCRGGSPE